MKERMKRVTVMQSSQKIQVRYPSVNRKATKEAKRNENKRENHASEISWRVNSIYRERRRQTGYFPPIAKKLSLCAGSEGFSSRP